MKPLNTALTWLLFLIHFQDASGSDPVRKGGQLTQIFFVLAIFFSSLRKYLARAHCN